jgi:hypothetical protein
MKCLSSSVTGEFGAITFQGRVLSLFRCSCLKAVESYQQLVGERRQAKIEGSRAKLAGRALVDTVERNSLARIFEGVRELR